MQDSWQSGTAYDRYMGRWSSLIAREFLSWLALPAGLVWLDVGCGTGSLTRRILESYQPQTVIAIDSSLEFLSEARRSINHPSVHFRVGLAQALELDSDSIDAVVTGLVLNFVPKPETALAEMLRVARPGGNIGIFIWDYAEGMQMLRYFWDAVVLLDPGASVHDEGIRFPLCQPGQLESLVRKAGLEQVEAKPIEIQLVFQNFDDYWLPFLGGAGPASGYMMSLSLKDRLKLSDRLRDSLPADELGAIRLRARAWAVKGTT